MNKILFFLLLIVAAPCQNQEMSNEHVPVPPIGEIKPKPGTPPRLDKKPLPPI